MMIITIRTWWFRLEWVCVRVPGRVTRRVGRCLKRFYWTLTVRELTRLLTQQPGYLFWSIGFIPGHSGEGNRMVNFLMVVSVRPLCVVYLPTPVMGGVLLSFMNLPASSSLKPSD
jgi:hypothetical protein